MADLPRTCLEPYSYRLYFASDIQVTRMPGAATPRSTCPLSCALDLLGDRWSILVLRDIVMRDRHHFEELAKDEGIATNILADRLRRLRAAGLITKIKDPHDGRQRYYAATERAADLIPTLLELGLWGARHAEHSDGDPHLLERTASDRDRLVVELRTRALNP